MRRATRLALTAALLAAVLSPGFAASGATPGCGTSDVGGGWLASAPTFTAGPPAVTLLAAPAYAPDLLYASNGSVLSRSDDGGCTWTPSYSPTSGGTTGATASITALAAPSSASSSRHVYLGLTSVLAGVATPAIASSADQGANWTRVDAQAGLPVAGSVTQLTANPTVQQSAYAVVSVDVPGLRRSSILATNDGGASWAARTGASDEFGGTDLRADALEQTRLFAVLGSRVVTSRDGGATFRTSTAPGGPVTQLSLASGGGGSRLAAARSDLAAVERSDDKGQTWRTVPLKLRPREVAMAPLRDLVVATDGNDVDLTGGFGSLRVSPRGGAPTRLSVSAPTAEGFAVAGVVGGKVLRAVFGLTPGGMPTPVLPGSLRPVTLLPHGVSTSFPPVLQPVALKLSLPAGGSMQVPYSLLVPRSPTPVDLMFAIDTTGSMAGVINGLRQDLGKIVEAISGAGLDAQFGLADFRDYPDGAPDYPYKLDAVIGPREPMAAALNGLDVGGGGDGPESSLTALLQSTTGQGQAPWVAKGLQARYRPEAFKFVLLSTDTEFHRAGDPYGNGRWPGPSLDAVLKALVSHGVHQIGLAAGSGAEKDMRIVARESRALAPAGGVDCNGDGLVDVAAGGPLVCPLYDLVSDSSAGLAGGGAISGVALSGAVVSVVNGIEDLQPVRLSVTRGATVAQFPDAAPTTVNLKADNELDRMLELHCPMAAPSTHRVAVEGKTPTRVLATGGVELSCGGPPVAAAVPDVLAPLAIAAQAAVPGPVQPITQPAPNPQPNPNVNPNVNVNGAVVEQEQTTPQLALAENDAPGTEELAFSRVDSSRAPDFAFVGTAALLLSVAAAAAVRQRVQPSGGWARH